VETVNLRDRIIEKSAAYRLWQAPFADRKIAPVLAANDLSRVRRVLDVGCGPGTSTAYFAESDYLGIDMNPEYIRSAQERTGRRFIVADVTQYEVEDEAFDFVLVNSFFHHIDDEGTDRILEHLGTLLTDDGHIHILDLILPDRPSISRTLARWDRGEYPRRLDHWRELFGRRFSPVQFDPYPLGAFGVTLWNMVYFKGTPRT
jgi:SAM-dependent methyltransferase